MKDAGRNNAVRILTILIGLILLAYLLVLIKITLIKGTTIPRIVQNLTTGNVLLRSLNLVPFRTISDYLQYRHDMNFLRWFANIFGNMLIFVPLGLYLPLLFRRMRKYAAVLLVIVALSISLEALQYLFGTGSSDIDDLLLNTVGGSFGYGMFVIISRASPRRAAALFLTLAMSAGFGAGGYFVAYREFGLYLGLATLREEVRGNEGIPDRRPDAAGTVMEARENSLTLTSFNNPAGTAALSEPTGRIEVLVGPQTKFHERQTSLQGHTMITSYVPYTFSAPADVPKDSYASVWGRWEGGRILAEVVVTTRPPKAIGTTAVMQVQATPAASALPKTRPDLKGHFRTAAGDEISLNKILTSERGGASFAVTTSSEGRFRITPETIFYRRRILKGGREVFVTDGNRNDLAARVMVDVWGRMEGGILIAEVVCINTFK